MVGAHFSEFVDLMGVVGIQHGDHAGRPANDPARSH